jgi:hypothetical protein
VQCLRRIHRRVGASRPEELEPHEHDRDDDEETFDDHALFPGLLRHAMTDDAETTQKSAPASNPASYFQKNRFRKTSGKC